MINFNYSKGFKREWPMEYATWYDFKKECEKRLGHSLLNSTWLQVKPANHLPWDDADTKAVVSAVTHLRRTTRNAGLEAAGKH